MDESTKRIWDVSLGCLQFLLALIGASWVYFRFRLEGTADPRIEFSVDCNFLGPVEGDYLAAFEVRATNRGNVEHRFTEINLKVLGIKAGENLTDFKGHEPLLCFPHQIVRGANLVPKNFGYFFVRPGVNQTFSFATKISADFRFVIARVTFKYQGSEDLHTAEKVMQVISTIDRPEVSPHSVAVSGLDVPSDAD